MAIDRLSSVSSLAVGDALALSSLSAGMDAKVALSVLVDFLRDQLGGAGGLVTQFAAPNASGFTVTVLSAGDGDVWLLLTAAAGYAAGTIVLPAPDTCQDQQTLQVSSTQSLAALTVSGNGATVYGAPAALVAGGFFTLRFDAVTQAWYRIS